MNFKHYEFLRFLAHLFLFQNPPFLHHDLQDSFLPPASPNANEQDDYLPPSPPTTPNPDEIFGPLAFLCASVPAIAATFEVSQKPPLNPPQPPPLPKPRPKSPDHSYASPRLSKTIRDRDKLIWSLNLKVKSLELARKRDRIKLELARKKIAKFEKGHLARKTKVGIVQHMLGSGTSLTSTIITNLINHAENPKGKSNQYLILSTFSILSKSQFCPTFQFRPILNSV